MIMNRRTFLSIATVAAVPAISQANPAALQSVHKVFIEKMGNDFDSDLRIQITRQFKGRVNVVLDREVADAVLVGVTKEDKANGGKATLRYLGIDSVNAGSLTLIDKSGKIVLWTDEVGDRAPWFSGGGVVPSIQKTLAERLIRKMKRAFDTAK